MGGGGVVQGRWARAGSRGPSGDSGRPAARAARGRERLTAACGWGSVAVFYGWAFLLNAAWALVKNFDTFYGAARPGPARRLGPLLESCDSSVSAGHGRSLVAALRLSWSQA